VVSLKLVHIVGDTYYVPGLTNVGVYGDYVIDPGKNERVDWANPERTFGRRFIYAVITHGHHDHFWHAADLRSRGALVYAPRGEMPMIEDTGVLTKGFFQWVRPPEEMKPWYFKGTPCKVDGFVDDVEMPLKVVPLAGHTDWHVGYMTPDGVLMAGDAIAAKDAWEKAGIVYNIDIPRTRRTLKCIMDTDADRVLPAHAGPLTREEAAEAAEANLEGIARLERLVISAMDGRGASTEDVICSVCRELKLEDTFNVHLVAETVVRAMLHSLYEAGEADYELNGHKVLWRNR
jgi:glyoxylase-like metal-dependent hydrolase (beta-lactamase superfamily II)